MHDDTEIFVFCQYDIYAVVMYTICYTDTYEKAVIFTFTNRTYRV